MLPPSKVRYMYPNEEMTEAQKPFRSKRSDFFQVLENYQQENCGRNKFHGSETISPCIGPVEQTGKAVTLFFIIIFIALRLR